jgi:signal transduction histidine kinase
MIDGVLTYSTLNGAEIKLELIDLNEVIGDIENDLEVVIQQKGAIFKRDHLPQFEGVKVLIYQLFYNLLNNSLKFSQENVAPRIEITSEVKTINKVDHAVIKVSDNGIGFDKEHNEMVFQPFTRLNPKTRYDGTGLGLALAKKIVERHHGSIAAEGKLNAGVSFTITLPIKQNDVFRRMT